MTKKNETSIDLAQEVSESKIEDLPSIVNLVSKKRITIAALPEKFDRDRMKKKMSIIVNKSKKTRKSMAFISPTVLNNGEKEAINLQRDELMFLKDEQSPSSSITNKLLNENLIGLINEANTYLSNRKKPARVDLPHFRESFAFWVRLKATELTPLRSLPHVSLLKSICQFYTEITKRGEHLKEIPLFFLAYEFFLSKLSYRERTENYLIKAIETSLSLLHISRLSNFVKLMGMLKGQKNLQSTNFIFYDGRDLFNYFDLLQKLDDNPVGGKENRFLGIKEVVGLSKAQDIAIKSCGALANLVGRNEIEKVFNEIKEAKMDDPIVTRKFVVDVDLVAEKLFWLHDLVYDVYLLPFSAVDIDGSEALSVNEFLLLMRNIERESKINQSNLINIFNNEYDQVDEEKNENCIGFRRFATICLKHGLCSKAKQDTFMASANDEIKEFKILKEEFEVKKNLIKLKLIKSGMKIQKPLN